MIVFFGGVGKLTLALSHDSPSSDNVMLLGRILFFVLSFLLRRGMGACVAGGAGGKNRLAVWGSRGSVRDLKIRILVVSSSNSLFLNERNGDFVQQKMANNDQPNKTE